MLAEIFMLRLQAKLRSTEPKTPPGRDPRFVPFVPKR
jgi:hypothetical protein